MGVSVVVTSWVHTLWHGNGEAQRGQYDFTQLFTKSIGPRLSLAKIVNACCSC